jgi:hypothetical protein
MELIAKKLVKIATMKNATLMGDVKKKINAKILIFIMNFVMLLAGKIAQLKVVI